MDDPRLTPARPDLAAKYLEGKVKADRFVAGEEFEVVEAIAPLREAPSAGSMLATQALMGERVTIYDRGGEGWAWGQLNGDGYVGWLPDRALAKAATAVTHKITAIRTFAFPGPSIKLPPADTLVMGSLLKVAREDGPFAVTRDGLYVPLQHVGAIDHHEDDFVTVAERFVGTPYLWGGKSSLGIDCSGLVQWSYAQAGLHLDRTTYEQINDGIPVPRSQVRPGDLVFPHPGHVQLAIGNNLVVEAPYSGATVRISPLGGDVQIRRPF